MDTLKTAVVVLLLLAVLYGVYVVLNKPTDSPMASSWQPEPFPELEVDLGNGQPSSTFPETADSSQQAAPAPPSWSMPPSMPPAELSQTLPEAAGTEDRSTATSPVPAPNLLAEQPVTAQPPAATGGEGSWPADPAAGTDYAAPYDEAVISPAAENAAQVTPWSPPETNNETAPASEEPRAGVDSDLLGSLDTAPGSGLAAGSYSPFESAIRSAESKVENEQWHDALWTLSLFYGSPDLDEQQQELLLSWLDPLAAKVIYSREHLIENAYVVRADDTLESVAESHGVPWQLLANINGLSASARLEPGSTLKVVRGPLRAEVNLDSSVLTVFVGKLYAGQFPISAGQDPPPKPGEYRIQEKAAGRTYYAGDGQTIPPGDPGNPFGAVWMDLGDQVSLHGRAVAAPSESRGCIALAPEDANDLYGILSKGSSVTILR